MFSMILSAAVIGVEAKAVQVEADVCDGLPMFCIGGRSVHRSTGGGRPGTDGSAEYGNRRSAKTGNS